MIPKYHAERTHEIPDEYLSEVLPAARKVITGMIESGLPSDYNILQNNGAIAHQVHAKREGGIQKQLKPLVNHQMVMHVHYHIIPKPNEEDGLGVEWPAKKADMAELKSLCEQIVSKM